MSDFPTFHQHLPVISTYSPESHGAAAVAYSGVTAPSSNLWESANAAIYVPFRIHSLYNVARLWWSNGSAVAGNLDCGIYSEDGTKLVSTGSQAQSGTSTVQSVAAPFTLTAGSYYLALMASSASTRIFAQTASNHAPRNLILAGIAMESVGSLPLPNNFTLSTNTFTRLPLFGFTSRSVI